MQVPRPIYRWEDGHISRQLSHLLRQHGGGKRGRRRGARPRPPAPAFLLQNLCFQLKRARQHSHHTASYFSGLHLQRLHVLHAWAAGPGHCHHGLDPLELQLACSFFMAPALIKRGVTALAPHVLASPFFLRPCTVRLPHRSINNNMTHARDKGTRHEWIQHHIVVNGEKILRIRRDRERSREGERDSGSVQC
jgi:hypothetical protein